MHVFWHRRDLRLRDNRGLALAADDRVLPVFVVDRDLFDRIGRRQRAFFLAGVEALARRYRRRDGTLLVRTGSPADVLSDIVDEYDADRVFYNRHYRPERRERERRVDGRLPTESVTDLVLVDPDRLDSRYENHSRFHDDWQDEPKSAPVDPPPADSLVAADEAAVSHSSDGGNLDTEADIDAPEPGYRAARDRYDRFLDDGIATYAETRDDMAAAVDRPVGAVSRLSPYLAAGMIGIREVWIDATERYEAATGDERRNVGKFRYELSWREQNYHLLAQNPDLSTANLKPLPNEITWENDPAHVEAWKRGETGYPFVDAGMSQLEREGYVHNRPRQIVASFLTKHLLTDWRIGARHFADRLIDHDPATNAGNWQWIASTGTDSVDVRIFDPVAQMAKYDADATYVKRYVPELRGAAADAIVDWPTLDRSERERLAPDYPHPIVDRDAAYERAQRVFETALGKR